MVLGALSFWANAQVQTINTNLYRYRPDLTNKEYWDIDRINYMPKEDWALYAADPVSMPIRWLHFARSGSKTTIDQVN